MTEADGDRATAELMDLLRQWPGEMMLLLAQVGALGVGGFQLDVGSNPPPLFSSVMYLPSRPIRGIGY